MKEYTITDKICADCVPELWLNGEIGRTGKRGKCAFCGAVKPAWTLEQLTDRIEKVLLCHYERTPDQPSDWEYYRQHADKESTYQWYREGQTAEDILANEFDINRGAAGVIAEELRDRHSDPHSVDETEFSWEAQYEARGISDERWAREWAAFEQILKSEARFFSQKVSDHLNAVFGGLEKFRTWRGKPVLTEIGPGKEIDGIYRARVFQSGARLLEALCEPDRLLGSPASVDAQSGRMNARGISVFYGAAEELVALSEVRPPVGSKVAAARFALTRPLQMLDLRVLSDLRERVSVFDPQYLEKMEKAVFLRNLSARLTTPVMPDDEIFDYLPTQAIADYLASQTEVVYDGIIYPSVQVAGEQINLVLFHKSARVEPLILPEGTRLEAHNEGYDEDGPFLSYEVVERVPASRKKKTAPVDEEPAPADIREPTLRVDLESVRVHEIKSVVYETVAHPVGRHRVKAVKKMKKIDFDF